MATPIFGPVERAATRLGHLGNSSAAERNACPPKARDPLAQCYAFTTENLAAYLPLLSRTSASALTVGGSGDQTINLALLGVQRIDVFDRNFAAAAYTELKLAALRKLSYDAFSRFLLLDDPTTGQPNDAAMAVAIYDSLRTSLSGRSRTFFDAAYECFGRHGVQLRRSAFFNNRHDLSWHAVRDNLYLRSTQAFASTQKRMHEPPVMRWIRATATELPRHPRLQRDYDLILLSNIWDYAWRDHSRDRYPFQSFVRDVLTPLSCHLSRNGVMAVAYIHDVDRLTLNGPRAHWLDDASNRKAALEAAALPHLELVIPGVNSGRHDLVVLVARSASAMHAIANRLCE